MSEGADLFFRCFACGEFTPVVDTHPPGRCPLPACGSTLGDALTADQARRLLALGTFYEPFRRLHLATGPDETLTSASG